MFRFTTFLFFTFLFSAASLSQKFHVLGLQDINMYHSFKEAYRYPAEVEGLVVKKAKLKRFPTKRLERFKNLVYLDLSKNKIDSIPAEIAQFSKLQVLILNNNQITRPSPALYTLKNLKILKLGKNNIDYISHEIGGLTELIEIDLWNNPIVRIPPEIKALKKLKKLDVRYTGLNKSELKKLKKNLPNTNIMMSNTCDCQ